MSRSKKPGLDEVILDVTKELYKEKQIKIERKNEVYNGYIEGAREVCPARIPINTVVQEITDYLIKNDLGLDYVGCLLEEAIALNKNGLYLPKNQEKINDYFSTFPKRDRKLIIPIYHDPVERYRKILFPEIVGILTTFFFHLTNKSKSYEFSFPDSWSNLDYALIGLKSTSPSPIKIHGGEIGAFGFSHAVNIYFKFEEADGYFLYNAVDCGGNIRKAGNYLANHAKGLELTVETVGDSPFYSIKDSKITVKKAGNHLGTYSNCSVFQVEQAGDYALGWSFNSKLTAREIGSYAGCDAAIAVIHTKKAKDNFLKNAHHSIGTADKLGDEAGLNSFNCIINKQQTNRGLFESYTFKDLLEKNLIFDYDLEHFSTDREFARFLPSISQEFIFELAKQAEEMPRPNCHWDDYEYDHAKEFIMKLKKLCITDSLQK